MRMIHHVLWSLPMLLVLTSLAAAQSRLEDCGLADWDDYAPDPLLGAFRLYVSQQSGLYPIHPDTPSLSRPMVVVPAIPTMMTEFICTRLQAVIRVPGTYYAVLTAVARDLSVESLPSNEISFTYGGFLPPPPPYRPPLPGAS